MVDQRKLQESDPEIYNLIQKETERQEHGLEMIPSENFVSEAILEAAGSILTNKYAEGLPSKRYYGGCEFVDSIEQIAIDRAKKLFGAEAVNVQPHSGASANQAVYEALLQRGDTVLGMSLDQGGHLTHGSPVNFSGKHYNIIAYGVRESDQMIDMEEVRALAKQNHPKLILAGASAYSRKFDFEEFKKIADEVGAVLMADIAHYAGLVVAGEYPDPIPFCDVVTTTTHKTLRGPRAGIIMSKEQHIKAINKAVFPGLQGGPLEHIIAAKAVCFKEAMQPEFKQYAKNVIINAKELAKGLADYGFKIMTGGTDCHMFLVDVRPADITGKTASKILGNVDITVNKNTIPFDPNPPTICSGIRIGTPALTTRGMGVSEMKVIARIIKEAFESRDDETKIQSLKSEVIELSKKFPLYKYKL